MVGCVASLPGARGRGRDPDREARSASRWESLESLLAVVAGRARRDGKGDAPPGTISERGARTETARKIPRRRSVRQSRARWQNDHPPHPRAPADPPRPLIVPSSRGRPAWPVPPLRGSGRRSRATGSRGPGGTGEALAIRRRAHGSGGVGPAPGDQSKRIRTPWPRPASRIILIRSRVRGAGLARKTFLGRKHGRPRIPCSRLSGCTCVRSPTPAD
jgi:hypothetical protein